MAGVWGCGYPFQDLGSPRPRGSRNEGLPAMKLDIDKLQVRGGLIEPTVVWVPPVGHAVAGGDVGLIVSLAIV